MLYQAFEALKTLDWGQDLAPLAPIDEAVISSHSDESARRELESRLAATLSMTDSRDAKDYVCRKLMLIGTAASVPALAALLAKPENSHVARFALERIPGKEVNEALRSALESVAGVLKVGMIASLGSRGDEDSVPQLAKLLGDSDHQVACAAAKALGAIGSGKAAHALASSSSEAVKRDATNAMLACAENLLAAGDKANALRVYKHFAGEGQPKHVRLAATRGMLACAGKASE
jgi:HEAT repeat protein